VELLPPDDPEVVALDREEAAIKAAHALYREDPELAADLERSGWWPARVDAAKRGEAIRSEGQRQAEPVLQLPMPDGQVRFRPSAWAAFTTMLAENAAKRVALVESRRPAILAKIGEAEAQLRQRVLDTPVRDLGELVSVANELLAAAVAARGPIPRTIATSSGLAPARFRERTDELELADAALGSWSVLDAIVGDEPVSVTTSSYGITRDTPARSADRRQGQQVYGTTRG
jgi:hypothetical protein